MNLLLDTNVFIDYVGGKKPFFESAQKVMAAGYFGDAKLWLPSQSVKDAFYVLSHYISSSKVQQAMHRALEIVSIVTVNAEEAVRALTLGWEDYEDCLIAMSADNVRADYIVTRDGKGFARSMIPAISPTDWLSMMDSERGLTYDAVEI